MDVWFVIILKRKIAYLEWRVTTARHFGANTDFSLLAAYEYQDFDSRRIWIERRKFLTDAFQYNNIAAALDFATGNGGVGLVENRVS